MSMNGHSSLDYALAYAGQGWPVLQLRAPGEIYRNSAGIMVKAEGKEPGTASGFHDATTDPDTIRSWFTQQPRRGVGVYPGGAGLLVLDVDTKGGKDGEAELQALQDQHGELPQTLVQRTPSGARHLWFTLPPGTPSISNKKLPGCPSIDIRCSGGYAAVEGTITTGGKYSFDDWDPLTGEVPEVAPAPAWLLGLLQATKAPAAAADGSSKASTLSERHALALQAILTGQNYHESVKDLAASLVATGMGAGAAVEHLKGVVAVSTPADADRAQRKATVMGGGEIASIVKWASEQSRFATRVETLTPQEPPAEAPTATDLVAPFPGGMEAIVSSILAVSPKRQPALAVLGALAAMAGSIHGRYHLPTGGRLNLYCLGLGATGSGKDKPRTCAAAVAEEAGALVMGKPASGQGLEDHLTDQQPMLMEVDEIGHVLQAASGSDAPAHMVALQETLLRLYSTSSGTYRFRMLAKKQDREEKPRPSLRYPCLTLLGFTTPAALAQAVTAAEVDNGLLGRFLVACADDAAPPRRTQVSYMVPPGVTNIAPYLRERGEPVPIAPTPEAERMLDDALQQLHLHQQASTSPFARALGARAYEKVERIAGVLAVWENPQRPVLTPEHVGWASTFVRSSDTTLVDFVQRHLFAHELLGHASRLKDLMRRILVGKMQPDRASEAEAIKAGWVPHALLLKRSHLPVDTLRKVLDHLQESEEVECEAVDKPSARGGSRALKHYRLTTVDHLA